MAKKKRFAKKAIDDKEMAELRTHNKIIDEKEKALKIKHQEMWKKKKKDCRGFNER
mgnify:CR=1 FL=1|tara:strand:- start:405 stop:572 length:168 start_codon:yes stop_codon:yes gene_type:complete